jgi:hypothetical protein
MRNRRRTKSRACSSFYLTLRGLLTKNVSWQAKKSILHTTVTISGVCENVRRLRPVLAVASWQHTFSHFLFHLAIFFYQTHDCRPPPTLLFCFPYWRWNWGNGSHFDTIEVIEAESQAVLNTLTEHDFQGAFKTGRSAGNSSCMQKTTTSRVMVASRPKVSLIRWQYQSRKLWMAFVMYVFFLYNFCATFLCCDKLLAKYA